MDVARLPAQGKRKTLHFDHNIDFSLRYHEKNQTVTMKTLLGYKGNSQPFDTVIWLINHIIVTLLYRCAYVEIEHPIRIMH